MYRDELSAERTLGRVGADRWALAEGEVLGGYRVIRPLGRGGMGEVYLAENVEMGKRYALKLLPAKLAEDGEFRQRFRREARVMADLDHPGIVHVSHVARDAGRYFLVMSYVEGPEGSTYTLEAAIRQRGKLGEDEARAVVLELCEALRYAHEQGVVHRDIKPSNILLDKDGRAKLSDFGLARVVGDEFVQGLTRRSASLSAARTGAAKLSESDNAIIGTYDYMSPEQKAGGPVDERSDIYSLGLVIYRILTGKRAEGAFRMPSELGCARWWDRVIERCLAARPDGRCANVQHLVGLLPRRAAPAAAAGGPRRVKEPWRTVALALVLLAVAAFVVPAALRWWRARPLTEEAAAVRTWLHGFLGRGTLDLDRVSVARLRREKLRIEAEHEEAAKELVTARAMLAAARSMQRHPSRRPTNLDQIIARRERAEKTSARAEAILSRKATVISRLLEIKVAVSIP